MKKQQQKIEREVLSFVEWILREFWVKKAELLCLDKFISEKCHERHLEAFGDNPPPPTPTSAQEKILFMKDSSRQYQYLQSFVSRVSNALNSLTAAESHFVQLYYRLDLCIDLVAKEMNLDKTLIFRMRRSILHKLAPQMIDWLYTP
jgi:hypothetical protein